MSDPRLEKLARVLVHYSVQVQPGQLVRINGPIVAAPLIRELYREAVGAGAHVFTRVALDDLDELFFKTASEEQLRFVLPFTRQEVEQIDASIGIWAATNTRTLANTDPKRIAARREAMRGVNERFMDRAARQELRWVGTQYPTHADAQEADMSLSEWEDFVFGAGMLDREDPVAAWRQVADEQTRMVELLAPRKTLRLRSKDIDLQVGVAGRTWVKAAGEYNFPDGELFTGPVEDSLNGWVRFSFPAIYQARMVEGVELTFESGRVTQARAAKGEDYLLAMLDLDEGARVVGEFAFGLNYAITRFTRNILFDEKIGGTVHMALGAGYPESGSRNKSALHWDMICDMRQDSEVQADGEVIYRDGRFLT